MHSTLRGLVTPSQKCLFSLTLLFLMTSPLLAVDGVVEINQAKALAGGVTPGDSPGFPVIIDQPGSYRLTSNLIIDGVETDAIDVRAEDVTLDLNGFAILGPIRCTVSEGSLDCTPESSASASGDGIKVREGDFSVSNGVIRGMGRTGIVNFATPQPFPVRIENVRLLENGLAGIDLQATPEVAVVDCLAARNKQDGILVGNLSRVENTTSVENGRHGLLMFGSSLIRNNILSSNFVDGAAFGSGGGTLLGNNISNNVGRGITGGSYAYGNNVIDGNGSTLNGVGVELGINVCDGNTTCP